jgi:Alginate export
MNILAVRSLVCIICLVSASAVARAQSDQLDQPAPQVGDVPESPQPERPQAPPGPQRPPYQDLRYSEDWSHIGAVQGPADFWDPIKFIPFGNGDYLTLGGEVRERFDSWLNANWGYAPAEYLNGSLQRYVFNADAHFGEHFRAFVQVESALEYGKKGGPWYSDKDTFEFHQAFVDYRSSEDAKNYVLLRVGRQEIALGADHFISTGDYFNARRTFDGVTMTVGRGNWTWFAQATKPVEEKPGALDDAPEPGRTSWGGGGFAPNPLTKRGRTSFFYTALDTKQQLWNRGLGHDMRHTLGVRLEGQQTAWDYTWEGLVQLGTFTPVDGQGVPIHAWGFTTDDGYTFQRSRHYPRIGLATSFTSGDSGHGALGTFHPLFPDTAYSGKLGLVGPSNGYEVTPTFRFGLTRRIYCLSEWSFFWRQNTNDGIYTPAVLTTPVDSGIIGFIEKPGNFSKAAYIGNQAGIAAAITIDRHITYVAAYNYFTPGEFLKETPPAKATGLFLTFVNYTF